MEDNLKKAVKDLNVQALNDYVDLLKANNIDQKTKTLISNLDYHSNKVEEIRQELEEYKKLYQRKISLYVTAGGSEFLLYEYPFKIDLYDTEL